MRDHRLFAAAYDVVAAALDKAGLGQRRRRLLQRARGRVLEIGAGTGANLAHYPPSVEEVVALEPDGAMRRRLEDHLGEAAVPVSVESVTIEEAGFADHSFDTVVSTLALCSVDDLELALTQVRRLLAPGGILLFLEHVRSTGWRRRLQEAAAPVWHRLACGCHLDRDVPAALRAAGLVVTDIERFKFPWGEPLLATAAQGVARVSAVAARAEPLRAGA
jgi:SAM-dependent methyltransferase